MKHLKLNSSQNTIYIRTWSQRICVFLSVYLAMLKTNEPSFQLTPCDLWRESLQWYWREIQDECDTVLEQRLVRMPRGMNPRGLVMEADYLMCQVVLCKLFLMFSPFSFSTYFMLQFLNEYISDLFYNFLENGQFFIVYFLFKIIACFIYTYMHIYICALIYLKGSTFVLFRMYAD